MLRAIQILGSSSNFISLRSKKPHSSNGLFSLSYSSYSRIRASTSPRCLPSFVNRKAQSLRTVRVYATSSDTNPIAFQAAGSIHKIKFCQWCGGPTKHEIPVGDEKIRAICTLCEKIVYQNPKMVVGCLIDSDRKILLCK